MAKNYFIPKNKHNILSNLENHLTHDRYFSNSSCDLAKKKDILDKLDQLHKIKYPLNKIYIVKELKQKIFKNMTPSERKRNRLGVRNIFWDHTNHFMNKYFDPSMCTLCITRSKIHKLIDPHDITIDMGKAELSVNCILESGYWNLRIKITRDIVETFYNKKKIIHMSSGICKVPYDTQLAIKGFSIENGGYYNEGDFGLTFLKQIPHNNIIKHIELLKLSTTQIEYSDFKKFVLLENLILSFHLKDEDIMALELTIKNIINILINFSKLKNVKVTGKYYIDESDILNKKFTKLYIINLEDRDNIIQWMPKCS